jgi:uncharacterized protein YqjF (DUF2071 family)
MRSIFLTAEWRKLIMAQYEVAPEFLAPFLPHGVELDLYHPASGAPPRCYVSLVGFMFEKVRVKGVAVPFHTRFEEVNLRFYVRRRNPDGSTHRGVIFINEFVPRLAIALLARGLYEEPYRALPTRHDIQFTPQQLSARYDWKLGGRWHSLSATAHNTPTPIAPGSEEEFITEHYWGYTKRRNGSTSAYQVEHARWQVYPIQSFAIDADFGLLYGPAFAFLSRQQTAGILFAEGAPVSIRSGFTLRG